MSPTPLRQLALAAVATLVAACGSSGAIAKAPPPSTAVQPEVAKIVSSMRADLDACYAEGRRLNPMLEGAFVAEVKVGVAGSVESVDAQDVEGLNRAVIGCMTKRVQNARFPAPGDKGATVRIPLRFKA
ncbi:MAG: AgmX/PglI C-terminal domain-containing protein [Deltaproteobacteria bacterium]|nr:AgmX/PglI C-terminal domain-containing protein [Deltaproteobacteria bacterium]